MKLNRLLLGGMTALMLGACTNDDLLENAGNNGSEVTPGTGGYLAVKINMGADPVTRSGDGSDVTFKDGEPWEYNVANARLYLFTTDDANSSEDDAVFLRDYNLAGGFQLSAPGESSPEGADNITSSSVRAVQVADMDKNKYLWALVVINKPDNISIVERDSENNPVPNQKFSDIKKKISDQSFDNMLALASSAGTARGILMMNAPLSDKPGMFQSPNGNTITTLSRLDKVEKIVKGSIEDARSNPAGCIYVERAMAKVTATCNPEITIKNEKGEIITGVKVTAEFGLKNINTKSYLVRNVEGLVWDYTSPLLGTENTYYRMVGNSPMPGLYDPMHMEPQLLYRTYWAKDVNYDVVARDADLAYTLDADYKKMDGKEAIFAKENTFTVAQQTYNNSTMAVFKVKFSVPGADDHLWILNDNHSVVYTSQSAVTSHARAYICNQDIVKNALRSAMKENVVIDENDDFSELVRIIYSDSDEGNGLLTAGKIYLSNEYNQTLYNKYFDNDSDEKFAAAIAASEANLLQRVNTNYSIVKFTDGVCYYQIPITHFGQISTPWTSSGNNQTSVDESYGLAADNRNAKYLGRYGVLRNNWYELAISSLSGLGSPVRPELRLDPENDVPDDNNEVKKYIGVETHILSWAKRTQKIDL